MNIKFSNEGKYVLDDNPKKFNLIAVGDCVPGGRTEHYFKTGRVEALLGEIRLIFSGADFILFNLETPLCLKGSPIPKCGENFRVNPGTVSGFKQAGFNVAALANNHIFDYGIKGLEETLNALDAAKIFRHGAGTTYEEATKALCLEANDIKISFLNFAEGEFSRIRSNQWGAAPIDLLSNQAAIEKAKAENDILIVSVHAGNEFQHFPSPWIQSIFRKYVDFGADVVVGHHPHIPQGIEHYKNSIIIYSLGDFMFEYLEDPGTCVTFALDIQFSEKGINSIVIHPIRKNKDAKMIFLRDKEKVGFVNHINRISEPLENPIELEQLWEQGVIRRFEKFYVDKLRRNICFVNSIGRQTEFAAGFLYNMFDCPSHRQALKTAFRLLHQGKFEKNKTIQKYLTYLYLTLEILGQHDSLEPYRRIESLSQKIIRHLRKRLNL